MVKSTDMNREQFIKFIARLKGCVAEKEMRRTFESKVPQDTSDLVCVDDIVVSFGGAPVDHAYHVTFSDGGNLLLEFVVNHRATYRWVATPDNAWISTKDRFCWTIEQTPEPKEDKDNRAHDVLGTIYYIDQEGVRQRFLLNVSSGSLSLADNEWPSEISL